jgi:hypothetical protein
VVERWLESGYGGFGVGYGGSGMILLQVFLVFLMNIHQVHQETWVLI